MSIVSGREAHIRTPKQVLVDHLAAKCPGADGAPFREICRLLAAVVHYETFDELENLRALYLSLAPDTGGADPTAFIREFERVLAMANYVELSADAVAVGAQANLHDLRIKRSEEGIRRIRFFARGARPQTLEIRRFWGLVKRTIQSEVIGSVVVLIEIEGEQFYKRVQTLRGRRGSETLLLKQFAEVPAPDLVTLHPGAKPTMKRADQLMMGVPAVAGGLPLLTQIWPALTVIFALLAAYFGIDGTVTEDSLKRALAAISGLVALGAFMMRQRVKYDRQRLLYLKQVSDTVYFHTVANNAGVIEGMIGGAEEQEFKEAALAYWSLLYSGPLSKAELDKAIERQLREELGVEVDFEIGDALAKLERYQLIIQDGDQLRAAPLQEAPARLDAIWDGFFQYRREPA